MSKISVKKEVKSSPHSGGHTSEKPELAKPLVFSWIPRAPVCRAPSRSLPSEAACPGPAVCPSPSSLAAAGGTVHGDPTQGLLPQPRLLSARPLEGGASRGAP